MADQYKLLGRRKSSSGGITGQNTIVVGKGMVAMAVVTFSPGVGGRAELLLFDSLAPLAGGATPIANIIAGQDQSDTKVIYFDKSNGGIPFNIGLYAGVNSTNDYATIYIYGR